MSHYLSKVRIQNFRSIKDLELILEPYAPLIGPNNAGKSNLLNAIKWLIKPDKLEAAHFNDASKSIVIEGVISGINTTMLEALPKANKTKLTPYVEEETFVIRRTMTEPGAASKAVIEIRNPTTQEYENNPTGISAALTALFPDPVRVEAMVDAPEDASKNKSTTTLGKLISLLTAPVTTGQGETIQKLLDQVGDLLSADGDKRAPELNTFDEEATKAVATFFPGINLAIHFPTPSLPDLLKSGTVLLKEGTDGQNRKFEELGHGAQRSIQMALVQLLASRARMEEKSPRCTLLLIDEPELYLHPQAIEQVRRSLKDLQSAGYQVIFSTHSPLLINKEDLPQVSIISKPDLNSGTEVNIRVSEAVKQVVEEDAIKQAEILFELGNSSEILFRSKVLLVEGRTEPHVIGSLYKACTGRSLSEDGIGVVRLDGCTNVKKALDILNTMGVAAKALVDLDYSVAAGVQAKLIEKEDPNRVKIQDWFKNNAQTHELVLSNDDLPTKKSKGGSEGAFQTMATDTANISAIQSLHDLLKAADIWFWRKGSIEHILGITGKGDRSEFTRVCLNLEKDGADCIPEKDESKAFCAWLGE